MSGIMKGKRGLVMGVANDHSIAWGIAKTLADHGAELAFTYQGENFGRRVKPLADSVGADLLLPCDVEDIDTVDAVFDTLKKEWGTIDFLVHAIAFSDKSELRGRYADTSRENFTRTMVVSCFSFTEVAKRAAAIMNEGGSMVTLTYGGSNQVMPNYNVMGVAKAALESSVRYLAMDFGLDNIRVNAISAGPVRTLAGSGVSDARVMFNYQKQNAPLGTHRHALRGRRIRALSAVGSLIGCHRRDPLRRFRLQHGFDATSRCVENPGSPGPESHRRRLTSRRSA